MPELPRVFIGIVNWNGAGVLQATLNSLQNSLFPAGQILVVDNHSDDDSARRAQDVYPKVEILSLPENLGFAAGHNQSLRRALAEGYDFALLLNNDVILEPETLSLLVEAAERRPDAAILAPSLWRMEEPQLLDTAWGDILFHHVIVRMNGVGQSPSPKHLREQRVDCVFGAVLLLRLAAVRQIGLLDERFWMFLEEVEFCHRARKAGYSVLYTPAAKAYHLGGHSIRKASAESLKIYLVRRNSVLFMKRYGNAWNWSWYLLWVAASLIATLFSVLGRGRLESWKVRYQGYRDGFCEIQHPLPHLFKKYTRSSR